MSVIKIPRLFDYLPVSGGKITHVTALMALLEMCETNIDDCGGVASKSMSERISP